MRSIQSTIPKILMNVGAFRVGRTPKYDDGYDPNTVWIEKYSGEGMAIPTPVLEQAIYKIWNERF